MKMEVPPAPFYPARDFFVGYGIPLRVLHMEPSPPYPPHRHDFDELVVTYAGSGLHRVCGAEYELRRGDVFLIPRGAEHAYIDPIDLCYINVLFDAASLFPDESFPGESDSLSPRGRETDAVRHFRLSAFGTREVTGLINKLDLELFQRKEGYVFMAKALFMLLWCTLGRKYRERDEEDLPSSDRVRRVIAYLEREGGPDLSVADMAEEAGTCVRNFHREFKKATGSSPLVYINKLRIEKACELLRDTDKTITQIAALVGYDDGNYFARRFRSFKACSPRAYRSGET